MPKKLLMLVITMLIAVLMISACGNDKEETKKEDITSSPKKNAKKEKKETEEESKEEPEEESEDDLEKVEGSNDFAELVSYMEEKTEGTTNIIYENNEPQVHKLEDVSVSLDAYTLVELNDFHTNYSIRFRDQTDGGVILAKYTVTNNSNEEIYYMPNLDVTVTYDGKEIYHSSYDDLLPDEEKLSNKLPNADSYALPAGKSVIGHVAYAFGKTQLETVLGLKTIDVLVPEAFSVKDDFGSRIGSRGRFTLSTDDEGAAKVEANLAFYEDRVSFEKMGEKKMLKEKSGIAESQKLGDTTVTLEGYQFTEFTPSTEEAPQFEAFANGIVLLTVKLNIDNKGTEDIGLDTTRSKLTVNNGAQYLLNEGLLLRLGYNRELKAGASGEMLQIYIMDQEQYEKIWKEKSFELEVGPITNTNVKDISKGKKVTFTLPN